MTLASDTGTAANSLTRVPAGIMGLLRQAHDSREKALDWLLACGVVGTMVYVFRAELWQMVNPAEDVNAGRDDDPQPNQDVTDAFPAGQDAPANPYTYNMPVSRAIRYSIGPSSVGVPNSPSPNSRMLPDG